MSLSVCQYVVVAVCIKGGLETSAWTWVSNPDLYFIALLDILILLELGYVQLCLMSLSWFGLAG